MKNQYLSLFLAGILGFYPIFSKAQINEDVAPEKALVIPIIEEKPSEIVSKAIEEKKVEERDIVNFVSTLDEEKIDDRRAYQKMSFLEAFYNDLEKQINNDPLFYAGETFTENDLIIKNQMLDASWNVLVGRYPKTFGKIEKAGKYVKKKTTLETPDAGGYKLKINPELDSDNRPRLKIKLTSNKERFFSGLQLKIEKDKAELAKSFDLNQTGVGSTFNFGFEYSDKQEYCLKATLKVPWWFGKEYSKKEFKQFEEKIAKD